MNWIVILILILWIYVLTVMKRAEMGVWYFITGSVGVLIFSMILIEPYVVGFLQKAVSAAAGILGMASGMYESYFNQGILFIQNGHDSLSMYIDFECSGVIEILAFLSLLWFFQVYDVYEKITVSVVGTISIFISNVFRIFLICVLIRCFGSDCYFIAHTIVGRIFFYLCMVFLYFYVFTKPQIIRQKVGVFHYERN